MGQIIEKNPVIRECPVLENSREFPGWTHHKKCSGDKIKKISLAKIF